jgi:hypothetical protein
VDQRLAFNVFHELILDILFLALPGNKKRHPVDDCHSRFWNLSLVFCQKVKRLKKRAGFVQLTRAGPLASAASSSSARSRRRPLTVRSAPLSSKCRIAAVLGLRLPSAASSAGGFVRFAPPDYRPSVRRVPGGGRGTALGAPAVLPANRRECAVAKVNAMRAGSESMRNLNLLRFRSGIPTLDLFGAEDPVFDWE